MSDKKNKNAPFWVAAAVLLPLGNLWWLAWFNIELLPDGWALDKFEAYWWSGPLFVTEFTFALVNLVWLWWCIERSGLPKAFQEEEEQNQ